MQGGESDAGFRYSATVPLDKSSAGRLRLKAYPRSSTYDPDWVLTNQMGPNVLWLAESLTSVMHLEPGMRVLDLGCGRAISSIFLAREFGLQVWATDLWIEASENWARIREAGVQDAVFPIHAEAHTLPYADGFFDAILSLDAYHYFGTDDLYIGRFARLVRPGGEIGISVPALRTELEGEIPAHLEPFWEWDFGSFHSPKWWEWHWRKSGLVDVVRADLIPDFWKHWALWDEVAAEGGLGLAGERPDPRGARSAEMLRTDAGRTLGFARVVARRP